MKKLLLLILGIVCLSLFTSCNKDSEANIEALKERTNRTVLAYMFLDSNLWELLNENINDLEKGWDPSADGTMLVYVDPSTNLPQFGSNPVLLEIVHDTTDVIVSKVIKTYEDADATDPAVFRRAQDDAIRLYPADSYGLIISGHGNGFFVSDVQSKGLSGSDRWSDNALEVDKVEQNLSTHYDFIIFDACLMGETTTLYQLRNVTDYVVASVELSPGDGFAYHYELSSLFTKPYADLNHFAQGTSIYYAETDRGQAGIANSYQTIGVYRMAGMEKLAAVTKEVLEELSLTYPELKSKIFEIIGSAGLEYCLLYPQDKKSFPEAYYYDMGLLLEMVNSTNNKELAYRFSAAIDGVVLQRCFAYAPSFLSDNFQYGSVSANLSFYIPKINQNMSVRQDAVFYNRFAWSAASGFTTKWE